MKLAVQVCVWLAVVALILGLLVLVGVPLRPWGLTPGGYLRGAQTLALLGIAFYCLARIERA